MRAFSADIAVRLGLALGVGLLIGMERQWARKDVGVRTFALTALLGALSWMIGPAFALAGLVGIFVVVAVVNARELLAHQALEVTTSVALMVTFVLGVMFGQGHLFVPVATAIVVMALLAWKAELARFAGGLLQDEIRAAVLLGLLTFVVYPLLPAHFVDPWHLINPREIWVVVIIVAGIGFANYVLLRLYSTRGIYYAAVLGGLVNSTATAVELLRELAGAGEGLLPMEVAAVLLTRVAMFVRNLVILAIFAPPAVATAWWPIALMAALAALFAWRSQRRGLPQMAQLKLASPLSLKLVLTFGALFLAITVAEGLAQRFLGSGGFLAVSVIGGLISSASTVAGAAVLAAHGTIGARAAGVAAVLASVASALANLPVVYRQTRQRAMTHNLSYMSVGLVLAGLAALGLRLAL